MSNEYSRKTAARRYGRALIEAARAVYAKSAAAHRAAWRAGTRGAAGLSRAGAPS